jgi:hypothetical protein
LGTNKIPEKHLKNIESEQASIVDIIIHELEKKIKRIEDLIEFLKSKKLWEKSASSEIKKKVFRGLIQANFALRIRKMNRISKSEVLKRLH